MTWQYMLAIPYEQHPLFTLIRGIEDAVRAAGVPINNPRMQPFHSTLGRVTHSFPVDYTGALCSCVCTTHPRA